MNFFSPSYVRDLDRFLLLRESIRRFATSPVHHVVAVPASEVRIFEAKLSGDSEVSVVAQQEFVSKFFYTPLWSRYLERMLGPYGWHLKRSRYAGRPGWIIQQVVKLSLPEVFEDAPAVIVDSDLVFIRPFGDRDLLAHGEGRWLVREEPETESAKHRGHMRTARHLLGLQPASDEHHYMAYPTIWYGDWVRSLRAALEEAQRKPWQQALFETETFSEYLLYGVFVEEVLRPTELEIRRTPFHIGLWHESDIAAFLRDPATYVKNFTGSPLTLVVQSNLNVPVHAYEAAVGRLLSAP